MDERFRRRPSVIGPVVLIAIGALALMHNANMLPASFWTTIGRLWPALLILLGVEIFIGQARLPWATSFLLALVVVAATVGGAIYLAWQAPEAIPMEAQERAHVEKPLDGATSLSARLIFGAGSLKVRAGGEQAIVGDFAVRGAAGLPGVAYSVSGGKGSLNIRAPRKQPFFIFTGGRGYEWDLLLTNAVPIDLRIEAAASVSELDLSDVQLSALNVQGGLSSTTIRLPKKGAYAAHISGGLSTTTVYIPEGVAARIRVQGGLSSVNVDRARFPQVGDLYESPTYATAENRVDLRLEGGLATLHVR